MRKIIKYIVCNDRKLLSDIRPGKYCNQDGEKTACQVSPSYTRENIVCLT